MEQKKTVFVTGVGSGIGLALCELLLQNNYTVIGTTRDVEKSKFKFSKYLQTHPGLVLLPLHLDHPSQVDKFFQDHRDVLNDVDILINNAGAGQLNAVETMEWEEVESQLHINFLSHVKLIKLFLPLLLKKTNPIILTVSSLVYYLQFPYKSMYCASKAALSAFSCSLRYELLHQGVRTHLIEPGWVRSDFHKRIPELSSSLKNSAHLPFVEPFLDHSRDKDHKVPDGQFVAKKILKILENPKAPFRVGIGRDLQLVRFLLRVLPDHLVDIIIQKRINRKTKKLLHDTNP